MAPSTLILDRADVPTSTVVQALCTAIENLIDDYWLVEGKFGASSIVLGRVKYDVGELEDLMSKGSSLLADVAFNSTEHHNHDIRFDAIRKEFQKFKDDLNTIRGKLACTTMTGHQGEYKVIGNRPNPNAPRVRPRKSSRKTTKTRKSIEGSQEDLTSANGATEKGRVFTDSALLTSDAGKFLLRTPKAPFFPNLGTHTGKVSNGTEEKKLTWKQRERALTRALNDQERSHKELNQLLIEKNRIIAERDVTIAHKDMLIGKYKTYLAPHEIMVDDDNGDLVLGSIGKRGMVEDYENERVREVKKRKNYLYMEVDKLEAQKAELLASISKLRGECLS